MAEGRKLVAWLPEEDERLRQLVTRHGTKKWAYISSQLGCNKQSKHCRRRWQNLLATRVKKGGWSATEDELLLQGHSLYGNKWTEIAKMVHGRTDNAVKNRFNALCRRRSGQQGNVASVAAIAAPQKSSSSDGAKSASASGHTHGSGDLSLSPGRSSPSTDTTSDLRTPASASALLHLKRSSSGHSLPLPPVQQQHPITLTPAFFLPTQPNATQTPALPPDYSSSPPAPPRAAPHPSLSPYHAQSLYMNSISPAHPYASLMQPLCLRGGGEPHPRVRQPPLTPRPIRTLSQSSFLTAVLEVICPDAGYRKSIILSPRKAAFQEPAAAPSS
eukprot:jgi/Chlat1/7804/Chrsp66S00574